MSLKASISGIRGVVGESLTPQVIVDYASAFASLLPEGDIIIGRDSRPTGPFITSLVVAILNSMGRNVVDVGIVPTPTVLFLVGKMKCAGGIVITASHNPIQWNALKLVNSKGRFLSPLEFDQLTRLYEKKQFIYSHYNTIGLSETNYVLPSSHIDTILRFVDKELIVSKKFKVALDTVNGAGGTMAVDLLKQLGCEVIELNTEPTGIFAHPPEPTPENLQCLSDGVSASKAHIGFALDPDGDRLVICGSDGVVLSEEYTLALSINHYLHSRGPSDVVINLSTSRLSIDAAEKYGCKVIKVPTGEIHVTEALFKTGSKIGGEGNGGVIIPQVNSCRDALLGMALILESLSKGEDKVEVVASGMKKYTLIKEKVETSVFNMESTLEKLKKKYSDCTYNTEDGLRIDFKDKWVLIRKSNTEPIVRVFAEAVGFEAAQKLLSEIKEAAF